MKKIIPLSLVAVASIYAAEVELSPISVESTMITEVSQKAQRSADVADALSKNVPSIDMNRRSGIANDIYIRGQKRDNISIEIDGTKVCGACPNRMDPPTSHVLASQIDDIEVIEGPYDVESFGSMSGGLKITTKKPTKKQMAELNLGFGSWGYKKFGLTASGGSDTVRFLITGSTQSSNQYKDGDGRTLTEQTALKAPSSNQYKSQYKDMKAYDKKSLNAKLFIDVADNQELQLGYTANRSDDILYANTPMDAIRDDSDIFSVAYNIENLTDTYRNLNIEYYHSKVEHPMSTQYRNSSNMAAMDTTNSMDSSMQGIKLKNNFDIADSDILVGLDYSRRNWSGEYYNTTSGAYKATSIADTTTKNAAIFAKADRSYGKLDLSVGARYDSTSITNAGTLQDNDYRALNGNIIATYNLCDTDKVFLGIGKNSRVPDARELYFLKSGNVVGTPTLKDTTNKEIDLGYETNNESMKFKIKTFYSVLDDYIYIKKGVGTNAFSNIDAKVYGLELSSSIYATDDITVDMGISYKKGEKDAPLAGQTDKDLADIAPLRGNIALNYEYMSNSIATMEVQASDKWDSIDSDNGEQELSSWSVLNLKVKHAINNNFDFSIGVNNVFDKTYAQSNTYADLTLITATTTETILLNEPGRYIYTNIDFKF
ncbi:TonB-dependent receptor [Sulfurimonas sp.]